ncbi:MAG TPA: TonB-dependent receptor [Vicinamibacterales bacterium]
MEIRRVWSVWLASSLLVLSVAVGVSAQSFTGGVRGVVKDAQGVIPGVTVTLTNEQNNTTRETVTNGVGEYSFPAVDPSNYSIKAVVQGYKTFERKGVRVGTQQFVGIDIGLELGAIEETITVTAEAPLLETANASTGDVLDTKSLESIPTPGRSVFLMANLQPTVQTSGNAHWNRMQDQVGNSAVSMGGGPVRANQFLVDGFPVTDLQNRASTNPTIEAIQDMKVQVHTYDSEMGRTGGGVMNMTAKSGANAFHGSAYGVFRPEALVQELLIPKLLNQPNVPEYWRNGGGGGGGPIVKNKTFFWVAGEKYVDNQPQQSTFLVPTAAELAGNFNGVTRNGSQVIVKDPLTGLAFANNQIPANRLNPVGLALAKYFPTADTQVDNGQSNFAMTDQLPSKAYQITGKVDQHFNESVALSGFLLRQVTHEANSNYNPVNKFVGASYQLDRVIKTFVVNNTYILNSSTVLTLRGGYNHFDDNYNLPYPFDATALFNNSALTSAMSDTNRFPTLAITGYKSSGFTNRQANGYYQYGGNGTLSKLKGSHSIKAGGDFRTIGATSLNYGASTGSYTFSGGFSNNALADLLLGYPQGSTSTIPLNTNLDGYVRYYSGYAQDDWRVNDRLTINYGLRIESESGMKEKDNQQTINFDQNAVNPLNGQVNLIDPVSGQKRQILGGLVFAGVNGATTVQGNQPVLKTAPRIGAVYSLDSKTVLRGGWGLYYSPWNYPAAGTTGWGQIGYSATTTLPQTSGVPTVTLSNPFPAGLVQPTGNSQGLLTGTGGDIYFIDPNKGAPRVQQYSADLQRELPGGMTLSIGYTGLTGSNLGWGGSTNALININQIDPKYQTLVADTLKSVPNPFFGVAGAGQFASQANTTVGQLLRPFPEFGNVYMQQSTGAHSQYNAGIFSLRKRATGVWGGTFSYTYSRLNDNQWGESNYYTSNPGIQNNYEVIPGSPYYNPDAEYGRSLLDSPHKLVIAPTVNLPFGTGHKYGNSGISNILLGDWSITGVATIQSGFPMGVTQLLTTSNGLSFLFGGTPRPNLVPGQSVLTGGNITDRITASVNDNLYFNKGAFTPSAANTFGNAPRTLPDVLSPWRNNVDLSINKAVKTGGSTQATVRIEVLNMFNIVQWAAPASSVFGNSAFGQINNQANNMRMIQFTLRFAF